MTAALAQQSAQQNAALAQQSAQQNAALAQQSAQHNAALAQQSAQITAALNVLTNRVNSLEHSLSPARTLALWKNGSCTEPNSPLTPVPHKGTGAMPPATFPKTLQGKP